MKRKNIMITDEQDEKLKESSFNKSKSQAEIVREALELYFFQEREDMEGRD